MTCNNYNNYQNQTTRGFPGGHSQKTPLSLRINAFNAKVLIEELRALLFTSPVGDGTAILRGHPSLVVQPLVEQSSTFILSYFETLSIGPAPGIKHARLSTRAQLFEGRLALNLGLNLTPVSFSCAQKHFLGLFSLLFLELPIISL